MVTVPQCPSNADGCFAAVIRASDETMSTPPVLVSHEWVGGSTTLDLSLPAGRYAVYLEGCEGDATPYTVAAVGSAGYTSIDLTTGYWETMGFLGHTCPSFYPLPSYDMGE